MHVIRKGVRCPCDKDCPGRKVGCHGSCEAYKDWATIMQAVREENRRASMLTDAHIDSVRRNARGTGVWVKSV